MSLDPAERKWSANDESAATQSAAYLLQNSKAGADQRQVPVVELYRARTLFGSKRAQAFYLSGGACMPLLIADCSR